MEKVIIGLSGGMDSATLLGLMLEQGFAVHCVSFLYGSKHSEYEMKAAQDLVNFYKREGKEVSHQGIDLRQAFEGFKSNLLKSGGDIPEGHYEEESMRQTVVPGRNMIMGSIMAGLAESMEARFIALGVHSGDHHIYPDCRESFIQAFNLAVLESSNQKISVKAPFIDENKESLLRMGYGFSIPVPYELTRTCYKAQELSCGKCGSCRERLEAFEAIKLTDPIKYE